MKRVVILMQENKTPDFYFPTLSSWGANIENRRAFNSSEARASPCSGRLDLTLARPVPPTATQ